MDSRHRVIALNVGLTAVFAIQGFTAAPGSTFRSCGPALGQEVCTWVLMEKGTVLELGVTIPLELVEMVPVDAEMSWPPQELAAIALPEEARASLGIDHLGINWEANGHPPGPFLAPHFDFHFYSLTSEDLGALDCADESKPSTLPTGYALPDIDVPGLGTLRGLCVPRMGMHAMPENDIEATDPFRATMAIGYYGGEAIFFEPMVSRDRLLERSDFTLPMPSVESPPAGVRYPREFSARYDAAEDQYQFVMSGFHSK